MITGIDRDEIIEYTSKFDKGEDKTIFLLGILDNRTKMTLPMGDKVELEMMSTIVKKGLKGIKGLKLKGEKKDITVIDDKVIDSLPIRVIGELAEEIVKINFLSEDDSKN